MEKIKMFDSEIKLMELLWENEGITAKRLAVLAADRIGWNKNTTYTVIKKLVEKQVIQRSEPNFICNSLVKKDEVGLEETKDVIKTFFNGSLNTLFVSFLAKEKLSKKEINELKGLIDSYQSEE